MHQRIDFSSHSKLWKAYARFPGHGEYELRCTCRNIEKALYEYKRQLERWMKRLMIPEDWKTFAEDTGALSSILFKSVELYFNYLIDLSNYARRTTPYISYGGVTKIDELRFPQPQIIPDKHDPSKYNTRVSRAMLHMFTYPGLTICRCEMDAERNISLLLFSLFDWFGFIQPSPSTIEMLDSIRVFKRSPRAQWTRDGFVPIVFLPQRLRTVIEHRYVSWASQDEQHDGCQVPEMLIPLTSAVEQTLEALLVYAINDWKRKRTTDEKIFVLPDWLFIHGIVYDALEAHCYAFIPKILECDNDGVPSQWEFICVPVQCFELFANRFFYLRANRISMFLAMQRHTRRICQILDGLGPVSSMSPGTLEPEVVEESHLSETVECVNDEPVVDKHNEAAEAAAHCLSDCIHRAGLEDSSRCQRDTTPSTWLFMDTLPDMDAIAALGPQKCFLVEFTDNWQSRTSGQIYLPKDWFTMQEKDEDCDGPHYLVPNLPKMVLRLWTWGRKDDIVLLTEEELQRRHDDPQSFSPDFYLSTPARKERGDVYSPIPLDNLCLNAIHSLEHFRDVFQYVSHEYEAKIAISNPFMCTPGCWLKYDTESRFPSALSSESPQVDFSLLLHPIQTVPIEMNPLTPDVSLRATILNPALVVAVQGPALWPDEFACSPASACSRPTDKSEALRGLAKAIEPSLKTHLINWQLRFEQGLAPTRDLPPWFMLFGLIYDAEEVTIVAHIPYMKDDHRYSFVSCIVDTISFPTVTGSANVSEPWFLNRLRVGLALLSLQKHAFHMAGLWECVVWPNDLVSWEEILEREYLGPVLTPAERGYMVEPHPMTRLYLRIHGSDETLDEYSSTDESDEEERSNKDEDGKKEDQQGGNRVSTSLSRIVLAWQSQVSHCDG